MHDHYADKAIDPNCNLCALAQTFRPLDVNPLTGIVRRTWAEQARFNGKRCNWVYSDGSRCKFLRGHTQGHSA